METSDLSHHILSRYNADLEGIRSAVLQMGGLVEQQLQNGVKALTTGDSRLGEDEAQACPDIVYSHGRYHMHFCYRRGLDFRTNVGGSYRIGYAWSTNLADWHRDDEQVDLDVSPDGWDSEMVAYPAVFELDGRTYMLYAGNGNGKTGFGLAVLEGGLR